MKKTVYAMAAILLSLGFAACSEDDERRAQEEIQKITDKHIAEVDKQFAQKETDLMAI